MAYKSLYETLNLMVDDIKALLQENACKYIDNYSTSIFKVAFCLN